MSEHKHTIVFYEEVEMFQVGTESIEIISLNAQCPECGHGLLKQEEIKSALNVLYSEKVSTKVLACFEYKRDFLALSSILKKNGINSSFF